ncbi:basic membrane protein [Pseudoflavonifractor capillosus ATCC 29799]|uniref:Basic membrane protein n=1 Tax=Pseudoflavonifractor capillosus ATCC 29799 TaxID=411467 RepID=A6NTF9_9FIRM|nr:BMP family ABC transporter substrate-binding protein [Pseudoflavonifractor capillosus]EDN00722.1 basic membrane protein [Pseudoflavonifractor capillosus ATCC 29799]
MKMKKLLALSLACTLTLGLAACGDSEADPSGSQTGDDTLKVGIVLSTGGLGDKNFNDMTYAGAEQAQKDFGIEFDYVETQSASDFLPSYRMFAESGEYDLIIGLAADQTEAITEISQDFPDQKISHIDSSTDLPNVSAVYTKWQEQTFLTGVLAGLGTLSGMEKANTDNVVGVILGQDQPTLRLGVVGFTAGVRYVNPDCEVLEAVVGDFNDPGKAKEIALSMYNRGADFIQPIAGASGMGVFNAAKEADRYAFGVGGNQNYMEPDYIVATALRDVNTIVYNEIKALVEGTWEPGVHISGIKEGSVGFDNSQSNIELPEDIAKAVEDIKAKIVSGELVPCESAEELESWLAENQYQPAE